VDPDGHQKNKPKPLVSKKPPVLPPFKYVVRDTKGESKDGSDPDRKLVEKYLKEIYDTPRGKEIIDHARADKGFVGIVVIIDYKFQNGESDIDYDDPHIRWNPGYYAPIDTPSGPGRASPRRVFAHELGHALAKDYDYPNNQNGNPGPNVTNNEKPIAGAWGEPPRIRY